MTGTFKHGRGVRQGSVGGPIKWCVFVNSWIKWVKKKMAGKGYKMANSEATPLIKNYLDKDRSTSINEVAELIGNMFIDDATWTTGSKGAMQELVKMCETFCEFHGVDLHREKSECFSANVDKGDPTPLRWNDEVASTNGKMVPRLVPTKNKVIKSLGVYFDMDGSWGSQIKKSNEKLETMLLQISNTNAGAPMVTMGINTKIIPTMAYPLQVAAIPPSTLTKWDAKIRAAFRKITNTAECTPTQVYYMEKEDLGFGIRSLEDIGQSQAVRMLVTALNDVNNETKEVSELATIVRAGFNRFQRETKKTQGKDRSIETPKTYKGSLHKHAEESAAQLGLKIEINKNDDCSHWALDGRHMKKAPRLSPQYAYTDGSTLNGPEGEKKAGWGWVSEDQAVASGSEGKGSKSVRLEGAQDNFIAETAALLSVLREHNKETDTHIFIDNAAVVSRFQMDTRRRVKERMATPARALWNRIMAIMEERNKAGTCTEVTWVHSHIDGKVVKSKRRCDSIQVR